MIGRGEPTFGGDLIAAVAVLVAHPALPAISVMIMVVGSLAEGPLVGPGIGALLIYPGWLGVERIWFLRAYQGRPIHAGELWRLTLAFWGRYVALGLATLVVIVPALVVGFRAGFGGFTFVVVLAAAVFVVDVVLTFVTPALAYSTRRVREALRIGARELRTGWRRHLWYIVAPPLTAQVLTATNVAAEPASSRSWTLALTGVAALLALVFKGAIAASYLRRHPTLDDGAAYVLRAPGTEHALER